MTYPIIAETIGKDAGQLWYLVAYSAKTTQGSKLTSVIVGFDISRRNENFNVERLNAIAHEIKSKIEPHVEYSNDIQILSISYLQDGFKSQLKSDMN